jgi:hypothetical protein
VGATLVGGGAIGVGGAFVGAELSIIGFIDIDGLIVSSSADVGAGAGALGFGEDGVGAAVEAGAEAFAVLGAAESGNILRIIEVTPWAVSDSGGGGGGIGTGGDKAAASVVDEVTSDLVAEDEVEVLVECDVDFEVEFVLFVGAVPFCLFTLVQRRPRKVVMLDSMQSAVENACGAEM